MWAIWFVVAQLAGLMRLRHIRLQPGAYDMMGLSIVNIVASAQRLHQPYRPLQPPQHLHPSRVCRPRFYDLFVFDQRILGASDFEPAASRLEHQEVSARMTWRYALQGER